MKHYLSLLCFALTSFLYVNETVANLLLKQNPTPLEPASYASSGESYQLAKVTWLPDYLGDNKSYGVNRVNDSGNKGSNKTCANYGLLSSCPARKAGRGVSHPITGLTCYKECVCDSTYYKYSSENCKSPKILGGDICQDTVSSMSISSLCSCPEDYILSSCPEGALCNECEDKYKQIGCQDGFVLETGKCVKEVNCDDYPLIICPNGGSCSQCPDGDFFKLDNCDSEKGWKLSQDKTTCEEVDCPVGYTAGVTTCGQDGYDVSFNGWSGGQQCGLCKCNNIDTTCTEANYPLMSAPAYASYSSCNTGCGSDTITKYKITSCWEGYELSGNTCVEVDQGELIYEIVVLEDNVTHSFYVELDGGVHRMTVDWGDRPYAYDEPHYFTNRSDTVKNTYRKKGNYIIKIKGSHIHEFYDVYDETVDKSYVYKLYSLQLPRLIQLNFGGVYQRGQAKPAGVAKECKITGEIPDLPPNLHIAKNLFLNCTELTGNIPELPKDLSNATNMFKGCTGLSGVIPEIPKHLNDASGMFEGCTGLTGAIPDFPSSLEYARRMFKGCTGLSGSIPELPDKLAYTGSISGVSDGMFYGCSGLSGEITKLPAKLNMGHGMFYGTQVIPATGLCQPKNPQGGGKPFENYVLPYCQ